MTKTLLIALALTAGCTSVAGDRGSGAPRTETRAVGAFDGLELDGVYKAEITIGEPQRVELTADDNLLGLIRTEVKDHRLVVRSDRSLSPRSTPTLRIVVRALHRIDVSGAAEVGTAKLAGGPLALSV